MTIQFPLVTNGSQIVDSDGQVILLRGVNWSGFETDNHAPHGLWTRDCTDMLVQIKKLGYNVIRLPFSVECLSSNWVTGIDFKNGKNRVLKDKKPLEVMDFVIQEAGRQGLMILLDCHRLNDFYTPQLWYGDGFSEEDWIDAWTLLAKRYKNQANVIGADLKNNPHGAATWGSGDIATDWRLAAERCGNAISSVNPNWLIVVEGISGSVAGQKLSKHWWGGNLEGVRNNPVRLSIANKLVYSVHEYGAGVLAREWFQKPTSEILDLLKYRWEMGFKYIASENIAPVLIGEFGGESVNKDTVEGLWQKALVEYIQENQLHYTYWSWNPNNGYTSGILQNDWININQEKQDLLATTLFEAPVSTVTKVASTNMLDIEIIIESNWDKRLCVLFRVTNNSGEKFAPKWKLSFIPGQVQINQIWNGKFCLQPPTVTVIPEDSGISLAPNQVVEIGYCAEKFGSNYQPSDVKLILTSH
ncbi:Cellulase (glycosyl hydrolase family 5), putative [Rivularia sp. IAM M-261]|nr:Cellulase (glycosyl hydrolase family 5), putative [Rivularia sp. IAM M-261]